jgi:medium-chain acyl-[acyl-carrier-protein] hydrolase
MLRCTTDGFSRSITSLIWACFRSRGKVSFMAAKPDSDFWIAHPHPNPQASLRLFCFPYAGGGASLFRTWPSELPETIEVCPILLPGRESRIDAIPFSRIGPLVQTLSSILRPHLTTSFAFFGHSMGAFIAFELARQLRREYHLQPAHLFVSGCRAPHRPNPHPLLYGLPEPAFIQALLRLNGTPEEVVNNRELLELMLPVLRADFALCETYVYSAEQPLDCSITAFGGVDDSEVTYDEIAAWSEQTQKTFTLHVLPGNHFFLRTAQPLLLQIISQELVRVINLHLQGIEPQAKIRI